MAEVIVVAVIQCLAAAAELGAVMLSQRTLLKPHKQLVAGVHAKMDGMKRDLEKIQSILKFAEQKEEEEDEMVSTWVKEVRDVSFKLEDIMDLHVYTMSDPGDGRGIFAGVAKRYRSKLRLLAAYRKTAAELEEMKPRVDNIMHVYRSIVKKSFRTSMRRDTMSSSSSAARNVPTDEDEVFFSLKEDGVPHKELVEQWILEVPPGQEKVPADTLDPRWRAIAVWGMGGLGKTTLLRKIFHLNQELRRQFDCLAWVTVSQTYKVDDLLRNMLKELVGASTTQQGLHFKKPDENVDPINTMSEAELLARIHGVLDQKRHLIVFDDVWDENFWSKIGNVFRRDQDHRSRIVLTTRHERVANSLAREERVMLLAPLEKEDAWKLFCNKAFWKEPQQKCPSHLEDIAQEIAGKCGGLPLAIVAAASMMARKKRDPSVWKSSCETLNRELANDPQLGVLMHSYHDLPSRLKNCFLYCSIFPEDCEFSSRRIINLWVAEGFVEQKSPMTLEEMAANYLQDLIARSMIQVTGEIESKYDFNCRIHDIFRMIAMDVSRERRFLQVVDHEQSELTNDVRRLSIHEEIDAIDSQCLRSLCWIDQGLELPWLNCMLLKVLSLRGCSITAVPDEIFNMFNLRLLDLSRTKIEEDEFPNKIERLQQLQTLDLSFTKVKRLPPNIVKLLKLRHLMLGDESDGAPPFEVWKLRDLQTLDSIEASESLVRYIGALTNLRTLSISKMKRGYTEALLNSLKEMVHLGVLELSVDEGDVIDLEFPNYCLPVQNFYIFGQLENTPSWFRHSTNLRALYLVDSEVEQDDPLVHLRSLPSLRILGLDNAYQGPMLNFHSNCFSNLVILAIVDMPKLTSIVTDKGALPVLRELYIHGCVSLAKPVPQIEYLPKLEKLELKNLSEEVVADFREICSRCSNVKLTIHTD